MVWIGAKYLFASTFSYRIPYFSPSYALSAPAPSPSTVKLALVASTINRTGDIEKGKLLFENLCNIDVALELPDRMSIFKSFIKRFSRKRDEKGFEKTFAIREYILYDGPLGVYLDVPKEIAEEVGIALKRVQYFGSSDSICTFIGNISNNLPSNPLSVCHKEGIPSEGVIFLLTDFSANTTFDDVNLYSGKNMSDDLILKPYIFPIKIARRDKNSVIYQTLSA